MNQKHYQSIYYANVNLNLMEENVIQINGEIAINVDMSEENAMYMEKIIFGTLIQAVVKMENI